MISFINFLLLKIRINKYFSSTKKNILFLNKYPNEREAKDGYYDRVIYMADILNKYNQLYVSFVRKKIFVSIKKVSKDKYILVLPVYFLNKAIVKVLCEFFSVIYIHSIYSLNNKYARYLYLKGIYKIWDVHGAVPEERLYLGYKNTFSNLEYFAIMNSNVVISVTNSMTNHICDKYVLEYSDVKMLCIPIYNKEPEVNVCNNDDEKSIILYSGGVQKWQQIPKVLEFVYKNANKYIIVLLVHDINFIKKAYYEKYSVEIPCKVLSIDKKHIVDYYRVAQYGLVIRDDNILNKVSCPTKLVEYISYGIVPLLEYDDIGDFKKLGLMSLNYNSNLDLSEVELQKIASNNYLILETIKQLHYAGINQLLSNLDKHVLDYIK